MTLLFLAALAAGVALFILFPVFARYEEVRDRPSADARKRKSLSEQKERLYEAIKDVDFEHRAGKLSDADYQSVRSDLVAQAAAVISELDEVGDGPEATEPSSEGEPALTTSQDASAEEEEVERVEKVEQEEGVKGAMCPSCEQINPPEAKFCFQCGARIPVPASCPECGTKLPKEARFCTSCGVAIPA